MQQDGLTEDVSKNITEMGAALRSRILWGDYDKHTTVLGKRKFEEFAKEFAENYHG